MEAPQRPCFHPHCSLCTTQFFTDRKHQNILPPGPQCYAQSCSPRHGKVAEYPALLQSSDGHHWEQSCCEEIGRLAQGFPPAIQGTDTLHFIKFDAIPAGRKATYLRLVVADRPMKENPRRVRFTVGGDKQDSVPENISTKTADLVTAKILFNSVLSTKILSSCQ